MKQTKAVKLTVAVLALLGIGVCNTYAQKKITPIVKAVTTKPTLAAGKLSNAVERQVSSAQLLANVQKFVAENNRWPRGDMAEESSLYKDVTKFMVEARAANVSNPEIKKFEALKYAAKEAELVTQTLHELETFVAREGRFPCAEVIQDGVHSYVPKLTPAQVQEVRLANKIAYLKKMYPGSVGVAKINTIKEQLSK